MNYPKSWKCPNCKRMIEDSTKCLRCNFKYPLHYPEMWHCPSCGELNSTKECRNCDYPNNIKYPDLWQCPKCGKMIKSSAKCPYCTGSKKRVNKLDFKVSKKIILPFAAVLALLLLILLVNKPVAEEKSSVSYFKFSIDNSYIMLPNWSIAEENHESIKLYDEVNLRNLYLFTRSPAFSQIRSEVYALYEQKQEEMSLSIYDEYTTGSWTVLCFSNSNLNACLGVTNCEGKLYLIQLSNHYTVNQSFYDNLLASFCCNC